MEEEFTYPPVYIDRVILNSGQLENSIKSNLLLCLKAPIGGDTITTLQKDFLTIKILEVRNESLSSILQESSELIIGLVENPNFMPAEIFRKLAQRLKLTNGDTSEEFRNVFSQNCTIHTVASDDIKSRDSVNRISSNNLQSVLNVYVKQALREIENTEHLSYFVYSSYDKSKIQESENFIIADSSLSKNIKITSETIINKGKISSEAYVFYLEDDTIWTGNVHRDEMTQDWYTGKFSERKKKDISGNPIRQPLVRRIHYNTKIQDFRTYKKLLARMNSYPQIIKNFEEFAIIDNSFILKPSDSPIRWANKNGNKINIVCVLRDLLQKNSIAYNRLASLNIPYIDWARTIKVKVYRKRVAESIPSGLLNKNTDYLSDFSKNEKKFYLNKSSFKVDTSQTRLDIKINLADLPRTGDYCYGVELLFVDPVIFLLEEKIKQAEIQEKILLRYYENSKILSYSDVNNNFYEGNYDQELNKFTNSFNTEENRTICRNSLSLYVEMIESIAGPDPVATAMYLEIAKSIDPSTGTPDNIFTFLNIFRTCLSILERILESSKNKNFILEEKYFNKIKQKVSNISRRTQSLHNRSSAAKDFETIQRGGIEQICDLCSLSIKKIDTATNGVRIRDSVIDRNRFPIGINIGNIGLGVSDLLSGLSINSDRTSTSGARNPTSGITIVGTKTILSDIMTFPSIDYEKTISDNSSNNKPIIDKDLKLPTLAEVFNNSTELMDQSVTSRVPNKSLDSSKKDSSINNMFSGIAASPSDAASKIVSNSTMSQVFAEQSSKKNSIKNKSKKIGR